MLLYFCPRKDKKIGIVSFAEKKEIKVRSIVTKRRNQGMEERSERHRTIVRVAFEEIFIYLQCRKRTSDLHCD